MAGMFSLSFILLAATAATATTSTTTILGLTTTTAIVATTTTTTTTEVPWGLPWWAWWLICLLHVCLIHLFFAVCCLPLLRRRKEKSRTDLETVQTYEVVDVPDESVAMASAPYAQQAPAYWTQAVYGGAYPMAASAYAY
mmetsp:Transcript_517/g.1077  ORF Transcript_517/g.1077 Transcript_517/m.1077 type:complete len:140 (+) Transcript_517:72-491(+)|eukprot:CAMPEP_0178420812 /NCGR_PEP_ID=MMETSP0689_2-20121128/26323_1 /TAXON_ID=160604 /ORGANISM="Amphidinium massartii, Strain CS-259" /LENGTH=139 /DNA_ID=CAMNT_0020042301 /DNA_START=6 /DNA_END=425 /DNA_ORIENTATION=-